MSFQHGGRAGGASALMKETVEKLSLDDMLALAAYVGSSIPKGPQAWLLLPFSTAYLWGMFWHASGSGS